MPATATASTRSTPSPKWFRPLARVSNLPVDMIARKAETWRSGIDRPRSQDETLSQVRTTHSRVKRREKTTFYGRRGVVYRLLLSPRKLGSYVPFEVSSWYESTIGSKCQVPV